MLDSGRVRIADSDFLTSAHRIRYNSLGLPPREFAMPRILLLLVAFATVLVPTGESFAKDAAPLALPATDDGLPGAGPIRRYEWFTNLWIKRREAFAANAEASHGAVVFLGDSITQGWSDNFRGDFEGMTVANRGISGDTTRGMLIRLKEDVLALKPAGVVMLMGTNDLEEGAAPQTIADNVKLILGELKAANPQMPIVLCNVMPSHESKKRSAKDIQEINRLYAKAVNGDPQITIVDTWTLFANADGDATKDLFPDLLHPNQLGYAKWKAALVPVFETLGLKSVPADYFSPESGFRSLFNGQDLTGWGYRPTPEKMRKGRERWLSRAADPPAWPLVDEAVSFDGEKATPEGRYVATNGRLVVTTPPEGRKIQQLYTTEEFGNNFELRLEFRATPNADSGVFLLDPQLQCRDYLTAGPYKELQNYKAQDWNELVIVAKDGVARCTCNGEVIEEAFKLPAKGPIGLEGDRGQMEYRRIRIKTP